MRSLSEQLLFFRILINSLLCSNFVIGGKILLDFWYTGIPFKQWHDIFPCRTPIILSALPDFVDIFIFSVLISKVIIFIFGKFRWAQSSQFCRISKVTLVKFVQTTQKCSSICQKHCQSLTGFPSFRRRCNRLKNKYERFVEQLKSIG